MIKRIFDKIILKQTDLYQAVTTSIENKIPEIYTYFNFHCMNEFYDNQNYADIVLNSMNVYAADFGMYLLLKLLGIKNIEKFNGSDFNKLIMHFVISSNKRFYFVGGNFNRTELKIIDNNLSGYHSGYFLEKHESAIIKNIEESRSDLIIIGMGIPKQEFLAKKIRDMGLSIPILCVGNFMEFYLGTVKRAPKILRNSGLEWIFRLLTEPKRLWKRYLIGIPKFLLRGCKLYVKKFFII